jgi:hypothetical protein
LIRCEDRIKLNANISTVPAAQLRSPRGPAPGERTLEIPDSGGETGKATLQAPVGKFSPSVTVNAGDCMVVTYGATSNSATDNETQVDALTAP